MYNTHVVSEYVDTYIKKLRNKKNKIPVRLFRRIKVIKFYNKLTSPRKDIDKRIKISRNRRNKKKKK